jgi:hypothetical protein
VPRIFEWGGYWGGLSFIVGGAKTIQLANHRACLVGTVVRRWTAVLEVVGSNPALAKQRIKFLGLLRLPARVGQ